MKLDLITNRAKIQGEINPNDEFYTPNYAILPLLKYLKPNSAVWCPFDTIDSNFVKLLAAQGHKVLNTHIETDLIFLKWRCRNATTLFRTHLTALNLKCLKNYLI